ncbi:MAG: adenylyltransferase/cytidyltransferase family protein [Candidatus Eremiobacteraeota bacterium]|nr:adenylyltransferase/cytidyltransferase family protein [Candidatus Eremiobacteraeota bacterium]
MTVSDPSQAVEKIVSVDQLAESVAAMKAAGKKVVLCHGVFDLLHYGHLLHFEEARKQGDALVVTITADAYVNKGPNRPAFTEAYRAKMLAALEIVDHVAVNHAPTAVELLKAVRPDVYAKGPDYKDHQADVTGKIGEEEAAVQAGGGTVYYTEDLTFSSSAIINRHLSSHSQEVNDYLAELRATYAPAQVHAALDSLRTMRVLVVGEAIVDEYVYVDQMGKSSKEPVLAMRYASEEQFAGGVLAIANHLAAFVDDVSLVTFLGARDAREDFVRERLAPNVRPTFFYKRESPTIVKRRYVESYLLSKLFEVYIFNDEFLCDEDAARFRAHLESIAAGYDLVVVADFGHGIFTPQAIETVQRSAKFLAVNTQQNAANIGYHTLSRYSRADFVCTNEGELRSDSRARIGEIEPLITAVAERLRSQNTLVTRGKRGALFYRTGEGWSSGPAFARSVTDRVGTGDAVLSWTAPMAAAGLPGKMIVFVANVVGAQAAQIVGNRSAVDRVATYKFIDSLLK